MTQRGDTGSAPSPRSPFRATARASWGWQLATLGYAAKGLLCLIVGGTRRRARYLQTYSPIIMVLLAGRLWMLFLWD
jgi:hypothetical protein